MARTLAGLVRPLLRISFDPNRVDTIAEVFGTGRLTAWYDSRLVTIGPPHAPGGLAAIGGRPLRLAHATTDEYSIQVRSLDGRLERIVRRPGGYRPPMPEELELDEVEFASELPAGYTRRQLASIELDELPRVDSVSVLRALFIDDLNRIWGRILDPVLTGGIWYDVFDDAGRYLGPIALPPRFTPFEIGRDYVPGVSRDELDVPFVEMYGLSGG